MLSPTPTLTKDLHIFKAGVFSVGYQNGFLRHIHYGNVEVIRSIYMALRDQNWLTYEHTIENEMIAEKEDHFVIQYDCFYEQDGTRIFQWHVQITGSADSVITFEVDGEALTDVLKNRAGICVLHPTKYTAGYPCELLHTDGSHIKKTFPVVISAENPFKNLESFRWRCHLDWYVLDYEGDAFETEDQRNWSDASYKTFCTPLEKPFPVLLKKGEKVYQKVTFQSESELLPIPDDTDKPVEIIALEKKSNLPTIGVAASTEIDSLTEEMIQALRALGLTHYRVEVQPSSPEWFKKFAVDCQHAKMLKLPLEIALNIGDIKELEGFYDALAQLNPDVKQLILLSIDRPTTDPLLIQEVGTLKKWLPSTTVGAGTDYNYRELNCNRFDAEPLDFVSYSIDPQEHAIDDLTIIENIAAQADTVQSTKELYGESKAVHVSSLTLRKRFNPAATVSSDKWLSNDRRADPRQQTPFAAVFTLGSIKTLSQANASSVTFYQTAGRQGILSASGKPYPVYEVLREVLTSGSPQVIHTVSSQPLVCDALLLHTHNDTLKLILANYTASDQHVIFRKDAYTLQPYEVRVENIH
jgi:hypothetical protein